VRSRLGDDFRGIKAFNRCKEYGVQNSFVQWDAEHPTGTVDVVLHNGQPDYTIVENVAYDFIEIDKSIVQVGETPFDMFYFGSLAQRTTVSSATLRYILANFKFNHIFYDVNLRKGGFTSETIINSLSACSVLKLNTDEVPVIANLLFGESFDISVFCKAINAVYPNISTIVVTASEEGCFIYDRETFHHVTGKKVAVNDAVGAGDAFSAAFMHIFSRDGNALAAASIANQIGAYVTTQRGALPKYSNKYAPEGTHEKK
jgi:fructokinase